jgi:hypothetical protein
LHVAGSSLLTFEHFYLACFRELSRYIEEFKLHHDPRNIRIIGPAYFLALDTCKLSVQDPGGWTATCAGGAAYTEEWMNNFNAHDPRRTLCSDEEPNATEKSNTKAAGRAVHAAR